MQCIDIGQGARLYITHFCKYNSPHRKCALYAEKVIGMLVCGSKYNRRLFNNVKYNLPNQENIDSLLPGSSREASGRARRSPGTGE